MKLRVYFEFSFRDAGEIRRSNWCAVYAMDGKPEILWPVDRVPQTVKPLFPEMVCEDGKASFYFRAIPGIESRIDIEKIVLMEPL